MMYRVIRTSTCYRGTAYITFDTVDINVASSLCGSYNDFYCCSNCGCHFSVEENPDGIIYSPPPPAAAATPWENTIMPLGNDWQFVKFGSTIAANPNTQTASTAATAISSLGVSIDSATGNVIIGGVGGSTPGGSGNNGIAIGGGVGGAGGAAAASTVAENGTWTITGVDNGTINYRIG